MDKRTLVAHRGDKTHYPENSYMGIKAALDASAIFIEFDVQMNLDHELFVIHDDNFRRTANRDISILESSSKQIRQISVHEPKRFSEQFYPCPVSSLSQIMGLIGQYRQTLAFVEIKEESLNHFGLEVVMDSLLKELKSFKSQSVIISYDWNALQYAKQAASASPDQIRIGWVLKQTNSAYQRQAAMLKPEYLICNYKRLPTGERLWEGGWKWMTYTINDITLAKQMLDKGIDLLETDDIQKLL